MRQRCIQSASSCKKRRKNRRFLELRDDFAFFQIALFLGEYAAAVFLHIKAQLSCALLALAEQRAEVIVEKANVVFIRSLLCNLL